MDIWKTNINPVNGRYYLGIDIGSISINLVVMGEEGQILHDTYTWCRGKPFENLLGLLKDLEETFPADKIGILGLTGTGASLGSRLIGGRDINEVVAQSAAVSYLYPEIQTVIEMGGEDAKLIFLEGSNGEPSKLSDFELNTLCAAGTGSFLDQQARRMGLSIEKEFGELALKSKDPPRIAGRCSVFAKSDMIHLQQIATPVHDIVAGLCFAVARNFLSTLARGKKLNFPISFQGGVAANPGVIRAFRELLNAGSKDLLIPTHYASMGAIGAIIQILQDSNSRREKYKGTNELENYLSSPRSAGKTFSPLKEIKKNYDKSIYIFPRSNRKKEVCLGIDIGSLSTNVVLIDSNNAVIARRYLPTASRPLEALRKGLTEIAMEVGEHVIVMAAGSTGSGRYLTGDFIGADVIRNEITAQATAAIAFDPEVDTVFEIGGQDSKFISIKDGVVVDFEMNKVCAAGTGSFLEEQAEKLNINIVEEFAELALAARTPAGMGDRCTVFMESDLNSFLQKGVSTENILAGLAYSIVSNYIHKVVRKKKIGDHILFQGGVTNNKAVISAFEEVTGKKIHIPPHFDVTGAIGAAILAREHVEENNIKTRFKGFNISKIGYSMDKFRCRACSNNCEIRKVSIEGEKKALFYGGRCEKYELDERKGKGKDIPDYFWERMKLLLDNYQLHDKSENGAISIGIPRGLMIFYQQFPLWSKFFEELGFRVVLSQETNNQIIGKALSIIAAETCFPVEVMHGHIYDLLQQGVDYVFTPFIMTSKPEKGNETANCNCPWVQTFPFMVSAALDEERRSRLLIPSINFRFGNRVLEDDLYQGIGKKFGIPRRRINSALQVAQSRQADFEKKIREKGKEVLENLPEGKECMVILGRPYNTGDPALNLRMVEKLINLDVIPIPMDFLPLEEEKITEHYPRMYWPNGQKILAAARIIARDNRLNAVYLSNFRCGPDSFLSHFVQEEMGDKPMLEIEIDEHSADAGMITRYEAFLDSLKGFRKSCSRVKKNIQTGILSATLVRGRKLYFPYMNDSAPVIAAACRSFGIDSEALPMQTQEDLDLGRKYTSSKECFPMICTTGSFLKKLFENNISPDKISFFMPDHNGPCRFGQYNRFQRLLFDRLGFHEVQIISPGNETSYEDISGGHGTRFRFNAWKGFVAVDLLRKMRQERIPYEIKAGSVKVVYEESLEELIRCMENGLSDLPEVLYRSAMRFESIPLNGDKTKPVVAVVGEIFMRDNPFCNGFLIQKMEKLGVETWITPFSEWLTYSTLRYRRDSRWKGDFRGIINSHIQEISQNRSAQKLIETVNEYFDTKKEVAVKDMLKSCHPYIHPHYDGDPALNLGTSVILAKKGISGIANILPFTCMPGTLVTAISGKFKEDYSNIPYVNVAYDGQEDASINMRLTAFIHQVFQFREKYSEVSI